MYRYSIPGSITTTLANNWISYYEAQSIHQYQSHNFSRLWLGSDNSHSFSIFLVQFQTNLLNCYRVAARDQPTTHNFYHNHAWIANQAFRHHTKHVVVIKTFDWLEMLVISLLLAICVLVCMNLCTMMTQTRRRPVIIIAWARKFSA